MTKNMQSDCCFDILSPLAREKNNTKIWKGRRKIRNSRKNPYVRNVRPDIADSFRKHPYSSVKNYGHRGKKRIFFECTS